MKPLHKIGVLAGAIAATMLLAAPSDAARRRAPRARPVIPVNVAVEGDFDRDGNPDVLWANADATELRVWTMLGLKPSKVLTVPEKYLDPAMVPVGTSDFDGDGNTDILFWTPGTGLLTIWHMSGVEILSKVECDTPVLGTPVAVFDYNRDGAPDILFQSGSEVVVAILAAEQVVDKVPVQISGTSLVGGWAVTGAADFDRDGDEDLVLYLKPVDPGVGPMPAAKVAVALLQDSMGTIAPIADNTDLNQSIRAVSDYDLDGDPDVIWENPVTGQMAVWDMNGVVVLSSFTYPTGLTLPWFMVGPR
jgi:hypothetical protein